MNTLSEFVGTIHIFGGPYRGNPIALYLRKYGEACHISPRISPWNRFVGIGETVNKAAADFDAKWKENDLAPESYSGPHWEGGIKPEKPKPPPKSAAPAEKAEPSSAPAPAPPLATSSEQVQAEQTRPGVVPPLSSETCSSQPSSVSQETRRSPAINETPSTLSPGSSQRVSLD